MAPLIQPFSAIKRGAYDYLEKPFKVERLILMVQRALEAVSMQVRLRQFEGTNKFANEFIGQSTKMTGLRNTIAKLAPTNSRVLISGSNGSGKELAARHIHAASQRSAGPFVILNASRVTPENMETQLFGTEVDGEESRIIGALEEAHGGTLYIEEVSELSMETQAKMLRVLIDQQFTRVGGSSKVKVDVRIISSSSVNIESIIAEGDFREDLYHRLAVVPLYVPKLEEHKEDIPELVDHFSENIAKQLNMKPKEFTFDSKSALQRRDWPGNIRQLRNVLETVLIS